MTTLEKTAITQTAIITIQLQMLVKTLKPTFEIMAVEKIVEAEIVMAAIKNKEFLIIHQPAEQTIPTSPTQVTIVRISASTVVK